MIVKEPIVKSRIRKVPKSFSWIDHRLVREKHIDQCTHTQSASSMVLACAADSKGLSFYGDKAVMSRLSMDQDELDEARFGLIKHGLIAWQKPIYQVLGFDSPPPKR